MSTVSFSGPPQIWTQTFDISSAKRSNFDLLTKGILRLGEVSMEVDLGNLPWEANSESHPSWRLRFLGLKWLCPLMKDMSTASGEIAPRVELIAGVLKSWVKWEKSATSSESHDHWFGHTVSLRATTLVAASGWIEERWLLDSLLDHAEWLSLDKNWDGTWNHGLMQAMALAGIGYRLDDESYKSLALSRIDSCLKVMIDDQGCINEQAPAYASFINTLLLQLESIFVFNKIIDDRFDFRSLRVKLERFQVHSLDPSGNFVQLGDSFRVSTDPPLGGELEYAVTQGASGRVPEERVVIFDQGFIYGRSGWGIDRDFSDETFYSIRFGPQRIIHGHNDHMSITRFDKGRDIIIDSGHNGYTNDEYREHLRSVSAHNVLAVRNRRHDWQASTRLTRSSIGNASQFFELEDDAYGVFNRIRSYSMSDHGPLLVFDRVNETEQPETFDQLWHLSRDHALISADFGNVLFRTTDGLVDTYLVSYVLNADSEVERPAVRFWQGSRTPHQGWSSRIDRENVPSPAMAFSSRGTSLKMLTAVLSVTSNSTFGHSMRKESENVWIFRVHTEDGSSAWKISMDGGIRLWRSPFV
jgi:hypothetical protein